MRKGTLKKRGRKLMEKTLGKEIARIRKMRAMSQRSLAAKTKVRGRAVANSTISRLEADIFNSPSVELLIALARALRVDDTYFAKIAYTQLDGITESIKGVEIEDIAIEKFKEATKATYMEIVEAIERFQETKKLLDEEKAQKKG